MDLKKFFSKETLKGIALALLLNFVNYSISIFVFLSSLGVCGPYGVRGDIAWVLMDFYCLTQLLYLGPMVFFTRKKGKADFARGIVFTIILTVIANVGTFIFKEALFPSSIISVYARIMDDFMYCFGFRK